VKMESYSLFPLPTPIFKGNNSKDIGLVEYERKLVKTCINGENDFIKVWVIKDYNRK